MILLYTSVSASVPHKKSRWLNRGSGTRNFPTRFGSLLASWSTSCEEINKNVNNTLAKLQRWYSQSKIVEHIELVIHSTITYPAHWTCDPQYHYVPSTLNLWSTVPLRTQHIELVIHSTITYPAHWTCDPQCHYVPSTLNLWSTVPLRTQHIELVIHSTITYPAHWTCDPQYD